MSRFKDEEREEDPVLNSRDRAVNGTDIAIAVGLAAIAVAVFWRVVTWDFVNLDDQVWVTSNQRVQQGLSIANIGWAFTQAYGYWTPLDVLSHMLDCQLFGLNPAGHHAVNLLYHVCNTVLLFVLLRRTTGETWCSALVAALFAVHPLNVEPVAWVTGRKDVLSTFLGLLALLAYARYAAAPGLRRYMPVILLLAMSLMVKPAFMPFPVIMLFMDYWPLGRLKSAGQGLRACEEIQRGMSLLPEATDLARKTQDRSAYPVASGRSDIRTPILSQARSDPSPAHSPQLSAFCLLLEKIPLFVLVFGFGVLDYVTQHRFGAISPPTIHPFAGRAANAATSYLWYGLKAVWPTDLAACYQYPAVSWWKAASALVLLSGITAVAILYRKRCPYAFVGWFWYGLVLLPSSGLLAQIGDIPRADRYAYVSMIGVFVAVAWGLGAAARRWRVMAVAGPAIAVVVLTIYGILAGAQVLYWRDGIALFARAVQVSPGKALAHDGLGMALMSAGRHEEAVGHFLKAVETRPDPETHNNLGSCLLYLGRFQEAADHFSSALRFDPNMVDALNNLGAALLLSGKPGDAIRIFNEVLERTPRDATVLSNLGVAFLQQGDRDRAKVYLSRALEFDPGCDKARQVLAAIENGGR